KRWGGEEVKAEEGSRKRWDMVFRTTEGTTVVEYDGDEHYCNTLKIKTDREKEKIAQRHAWRVVRFPYWVQLTTTTLAHYFGLTSRIEQDFPHGFITTKWFPASFCEMGVERFRSELLGLPNVVRGEVLRSLKDRVVEHGIEYVLPTALRFLVKG